MYFLFIPYYENVVLDLRMCSIKFIYTFLIFFIFIFTNNKIRWPQAT